MKGEIFSEQYGNLFNYFCGHGDLVLPEQNSHVIYRAGSYYSSGAYRLR